MSIDYRGLEAQAKSGNVSISIPVNNPLVRVANSLPWRDLANTVETDIRTTTKGFWWVGRRLSLRVHLAIFILQARFNLTDRRIADEISFNALYQAFAGEQAAGQLRWPDHSAICRFRNRLSAETQRQVLIAVVKTAEALGIADPSWMDLDSTVQEAEMAYPSDANIMLKLTKHAAKITEWVRKNMPILLPKGLKVDVAAVAAKAKEYFFMAKNTSLEEKREVFKELHGLVKKSIYPLAECLEKLEAKGELANLPWNIKDRVTQIRQDAKRYLLDVAHFIRTNKIKAGKILSLHLRDVACICKGKLGKPCEFGRVFQICRIGGNFLIPLSCDSIRMVDKKCVEAAITEHITIFGLDQLASLAADKGYYSHANVRKAVSKGVKEVGIQCPGRVKTDQSEQNIQDAKRLRDRRAGIEPLIGHAKKFGLGRSRMKSDTTTLASGYRSILGFNLRQLERNISETMKKAA